MTVLDTQAVNNPDTSNFTALSVFRFLLIHTWWVKDERYGWVEDGWSSQAKLALGVGTSVRTVGKALKDLEEAGMIRREHRAAGRGMGRLPDRIEVTWLSLIQHDN